MRKLLVLIIILIISSPLSGSSLRDVRELAYDLLALENTSSRIDSAMVDTVVSYAIIEVGVDAGVMQRIDTITLSLHTTKYALDSSMVINGIRGVLVKDNQSGEYRALSRKSFFEFGRTSSEGQLEFYNTWGHQIFLSAVEHSDTTDTVFVLYVERADATSDLPNEYQLLIAYKTAELVSINMGRADLSSVFNQKYEEELSKRLQLYEFKAPEPLSSPSDPE